MVTPFHIKPYNMHLSRYNRYFAFACSLLLATACRKDDSETRHRPDVPVTINRMLPDSGPGGTQVLITGNNFSADRNGLKVTLNGLPLEIEASSTTQILARIPAKAGSGPLVVTIGAQTGTSSGNFSYQFKRTVSTLAGSGEEGFYNGTGPAAAFRISGARIGMDVDAAGNLYVADAGNHAIRKISPAGTVTTLAGNGTPGHADGNGTNAQFQDPYDVGVDAQGNVFVADRRQLYIRKITPAGEVSTILKTDTVGGFVHSSAPYAIGVDKQTGNVFYTDWNWDNGSVCRITPGGKAERLFTVEKPGDVATGKDGSLYVTCNTLHVVKRFAAGTWEATTIAGSGDGGFADGTGANARFQNPWGIAVDKNDQLFIAGNGDGGGGESSNQCIRQITAGTWNVSTYAGSREGLAGYQDGLATGGALFNAPTGVAVDAEGNVFVADRKNNRIRKIIQE